MNVAGGTTMAIETRGLGKRFGSTWALQDCTVCVPRGRVSALVGPNGAGKTTLIRLLVGLRAPSAGQALVLGRQPRQSKEFLASVGYLAQEAPLYKRLTADEHLDLGAHLNLRWDKVVATDRLRALQIPLDQPVGTLSGVSVPRSLWAWRWPNALKSCSWTSPLPRSTRWPDKRSCPHWLKPWPVAS